MMTARRIAWKRLAWGLTAIATVLLVFAGVRVRQDMQWTHGRHVLGGHASCASALVFSPDGKRLYTGDWSGTIRVWQMPQGKLLHAIPFSGIPINTLAITPDGTQLVSGDDRGRILRWEVGSERPLSPINAGLPVRRIVFSPDSREMAVAVHNTPAAFRFDTRTGALLGRILTPSLVSTVAYAPDGKTIAIADKTEVSFWDRPTQRVRRIWHQPEVASLAFSPDSAMLVASGIYRDANLYRMSDSSMVQHLRVDQSGNAAFLRDGKRFLLGHGADLTPYDARSGVSSPSLIPTALLSTTPQFLMRVFPPLRDFQRLPVETLAVSPDGQLAAFSVQENVTLLPLPQASK